MLTSIRPLGRYRVRVEVGGSTVSPAHVPMAALQFNQAHVVFDFDGPEPDDYGVSYVGWILSPADRRRLTQGVQCGADLYSGLGVHWLCLDDCGPGRPWRLTSVNES